MMKNFLAPFLIIILSGVFIGGFLLIGGSDSSKVNTADNNLMQAKLSIENMFCVGCSRSIEASISSMQGVKKMSVSLNDDSAEVIYNPNKISAKEITSASIFETYPAELISTSTYSQGNK